VAQELLRLLAVTDPVPALRMMQEDSILAAILPEATRLDRLARLLDLDLDSASLLRLAALIDVDAQGAKAAAERLRLSNTDRDRLMGLAQPWPLDPNADDRALRLLLYHVGAQRVIDLAMLISAEGGLGRVGEFLELAETWVSPEFPIAGRDVTALGLPPGPRVGQLLAEVQRWWEEGDFTADREACLRRLREIVA